MDWFDRVPKAELHLHLEGAIPLPALWELVCRYGGDPGVRDMAALERRFVYRDFPQFIDTWIWKNQFIRSYDDFTFIAEAVARDLAGQNIRYAEAFFSPARFRGEELQVQRITEAIRAGLDRVAAVRVNLICDFSRDLGPEIAAATLAEVNEVRRLGVIGIGLGGSEQKYPASLFSGVYAEARRLGFRVTAHAGEAAGAESVWSALRDLKVERIGHGTRSSEDDRLIDYLAENKVPLEVCPLSNVRTGVTPAIEAHPVRRFFTRGLLVTIATDDPKMFGNSLAEEFRLLEGRLGFSRDEVRRLILQSIRSSWLSAADKESYLKQFSNDPAWNG